MGKKKNKGEDLKDESKSNPGVQIDAGVSIDFDTTRLSAKDKERLGALVAGFQGVYGEREKAIHELNALTTQLMLIDGAIEKLRAKAEKKDRKKVIETDDPKTISKSEKKAAKKAAKAEAKAAKKEAKA